MLIHSAEVAGARRDVRIEGERIVAIADTLPPLEHEPRFDARGGALLPGLHDHHLHLFALAAAERSLRCGPPEVADASALAGALADATPIAGWIRGIGYHDSVAGALDRERLDDWESKRPVRIQHRSGALWVLNSAGIERLGLDRDSDAHGVERDARGRATGRLFRLDDWLRTHLGGGDAPALGSVGRRLAGLGVTGLTDATATNDAEAMRALTAAVEAGELPQRLHVMGRATLPEPHHTRVTRGALKLLLDERELPTLDALGEAISSAHRAGRGAAIHCVTRTELIFACAAFRAAGPRDGDRIEHAGVAPPEALPALRQCGLRVVTQPHFLYERGDRYLAEVDASDRPWLYRGRGFLDAEIPLAGGSDAPFGDPDPWAAMQAAVARRSRGGAPLAEQEQLTPEEALALFTSRPEEPGGPPRRVAEGEVADLCLLDRPWSRARRDLAAVGVVRTLRGGVEIARADT